MKKRDKSRQSKRKQREARLRRRRHEERSGGAHPVVGGEVPGEGRASSRALDARVERALDRPLTRYATEQTARRMRRAMAGQEFGSRDDLGVFVQGQVESQELEGGAALGDLDDPERPVDDTAAGSSRVSRRITDTSELPPSMRIEGAQELAFCALEAQERDEEDVALELAHMALEEDRLCVDALSVLAFQTARSKDELLDGLMKAVAAGEVSLGDEFMKQNRGSFWGLVETRPYMRAREFVADMLWSVGRRKPAAQCKQETLALNPGDNQGVRYGLLGHLLVLGDVAAARKLFDQYADEATAVFAWGLVLERCLTGDADGAREACGPAHDVNSHCYAYLTGARPLPRRLPDHHGFGDENEAVFCASTLRPVLEAHLQLESWLVKHAASQAVGLSPALPEGRRARGQRSADTLDEEREAGASAGGSGGSLRDESSLPGLSACEPSPSRQLAELALPVVPDRRADIVSGRGVDTGVDPDRGPTDAEWSRLFAATAAFRALAPWYWMDDEQLVSLVDPETGETHHACVLGALGAVHALVLYAGPEGLECHRRLHDDELSADELLYVQHCLMASYEDREELSAGERQIIKRLGLRFRGRGAWPRFQEYAPGSKPWFVTGHQARLLTHALEQVVVVAPQLATGALELPPSDDESQFVCVPDVDGERLSWKHEVRPRPPRVLLACEQPARLDSVRAARLASSGTATDETWQFDALPLMNRCVGERGERALLVRFILWVDADTGVVPTVHLALAPNATEEAAQETLELFERQGKWPARIEVRRPLAQAALQPLADALDIELDVVDELPTFDEMAAQLLEDMGWD